MAWCVVPQQLMSTEEHTLGRVKVRLDPWPQIETNPFLNLTEVAIVA